MTSDILKRAAEAVEKFSMWDVIPYEDDPLVDGLLRDLAAARTLIPDMAAAIAERDAEIERLTARAEAAEAILADAGALRDAADRVSAWFATEARHLEGPRINGLRMAMVAYDRHMQPAPHAAMKEGR